MRGLPQALLAWRAIVGDEHLRIDPDARREAARATFRTTAQPSCIVRPADLAELQACLRVASDHGVPVYPSSRGRNLGYGSRVPTLDGAALLDLARLDRITDLDLELATVVIEPGVTFAALARHLQGTGHSIARTGAPPDASVLANSLERGLGRGRHGARSERLCGLHVVLADGSLLRTGLARFPDSPARGLSRHGFGPALGDLFFQSRLGVVASATLWLTPDPCAAHELRFTLSQRDQLGALVDRLRPLKLADALPHTISIYNDRRLLTIAGAGATCPPGQALSQAEVDRQNPAGPDARWLAQITVDGASPAIAAATCDLLRTTLAGRVDRLQIHDPRPHDPPRLASDAALARLYWRRGPVPALPDPLADGCGLLWCAPVVPARGPEIVATIAWLEDLVTSHGLDPAISLQWSEPRLIHLVLALLFDRTRPGDDARALACHDAVLHGLAARGLLPYRLGLPGMQLCLDSDPVHRATLAAIRRALDPADILAPGRHDPETRDHDLPPTITRRWQFGRCELGPAELELRTRLGQHLVDLAHQLPAPLRPAALAFLELEARGRGADQLLRKFPPPLWCFLLHLGDLPAPLLRAAEIGQASALLLHLLDDHLCDAQLRCEPALLQLRTRLWSQFEAAIDRLADGLPDAHAHARARIDHHFASIVRPREPISLHDALARARGEMATWSIVPALCVWRTRGVSIRDHLVDVLERLMVAWRIVDDLDDIADDARSGAANLVTCVLSPAARELWSNCAQNNARTCDPDALPRLLAAIEREDIPRTLAARAHAELMAAAAGAHELAWPALAAQMLALAAPLAPA